MFGTLSVIHDCPLCAIGFPTPLLPRFPHLNKGRLMHNCVSPMEKHAFSSSSSLFLNYASAIHFSLVQLQPLLLVRECSLAEVSDCQHLHHSLVILTPVSTFFFPLLSGEVAVVSLGQIGSLAWQQCDMCQTGSACGVEHVFSQPCSLDGQTNGVDRGLGCQPLQVSKKTLRRKKRSFSSHARGFLTHICAPFCISSFSFFHCIF